ncbi:MAG: type IV toxin-antitoxin system AbiEi family antitoxin domain-containing protein [Acidimicrobiales bacterium]
MAQRVDMECLRLAAANYGAVTQQQLIAAGVSASSVTRRVQSGMLRSVAKGVFIVPTMEGPNSVLAAGLLHHPDAVVSHRSAARLHGMALSDNEGAELTVPLGTLRRIAGAVIHETRFLPADDVMMIDGLRVTTPARTLFDLCAVLSFAHYRRIAEEQLLAQVPSPARFLACHRAMARRGRTGSGIIRTVLDELIDDQPFPASKLELRTWVALTDRGVNYLRRQFAPPWYNGLEGIVDFADPIGCTIIEVDGRSHHRLELDRRRDAARDREANRHGWLVIRIGWHEVIYRTESTMAEIIEILEQRRNLAA